MIVSNTDDDVEDEDETIEIHGTTNHPGLVVNPARVTIINDDTSGVSLSKDALTVWEGRRKYYVVWLDSEPTGNVVVNVDVPANAGFTVNPGTLTFTPQDWKGKLVFVKGIRDPDGDDEPPAVITHSVTSADLKYDGAPAGSVTVTVRDTSAATVTVTPTELTIQEGGNDAYTVALDTQPTGDVTVTVLGAGTGLSLDNTTLTFTTQDWGTAQTVTVTANEDGDPADDSFTLTHTVAGGGYDGIAADDVVVTVTDNDTAGRHHLRDRALTIEEGNTDTYTVVLNTLPAGDVTVTISGHAGTDVSLDNTTLTFTGQNWEHALRR